MDLRISQQAGLIGLNIDKPGVRLSISPPRLRVNAQVSEINIHSPRAELEIDQSQCWTDLGARKPVEYGKECASQAYQQGLEGIARRVAEGESQAAIEKGGSVVNLIASRFKAEAECPYTIAFIPEHPPQVTVKAGEMEAEASEGGISTSMQPGRVENHTPWAKVGVYLQQKPAIEVKWVGSYFDGVM